MLHLQLLLTTIHVQGESDGFEKRRLRGVRKKGMLEEVVCRQSYPAFLARPLGG